MALGTLQDREINKFTEVNSKPSVDVNLVKDQNQEVATKLDENGSTTYVGFAPIGSSGSVAAWKIKRIVESGQDLEITWADGNANFDNVWDNRASLTYT